MVVHSLLILYRISIALFSTSSYCFWIHLIFIQILSERKNTSTNKRAINIKKLMWLIIIYLSNLIFGVNDKFDS